MWRGITSLILSIISLFFCGWLGIVGAIIGIIGIYDSQYSEQYPNDKGLCCAGIIAGCISTFLLYLPLLWILN